MTCDQQSTNQMTGIMQVLYNEEQKPNCLNKNRFTVTLEMLGMLTSTIPKNKMQNKEKYWAD